MSDDKLDALVAGEARDYNKPGPVPRDEMWARIQDARRERSGAGVPGVEIRRHRTAWLAGAAAAGLLLFAGIAIGRRMNRSSEERVRTAIRTPAPPAPLDSSSSRPPEAVAASSDSVIHELRGETKATSSMARRLAEAKSPSTGVNGSRDADDNLAYRLVVLRHLAGSEAMITAFRSSARRGEVDAQIAGWSRELLGTTRLLEASPVAQDPTMKRLLEDLDLVIAQISAYVTSGRHDPNDLDLIERSINRRGVITELRGSLPVRTRPAGT